MNLTELTITQVHEGLKKKEFSALELCQAYLERIKEDKEIRTFLTVSEDLALSQAKEVDEMISSGKELPILAGVPCAIKDNILVEGFPCRAGSKILESYLAPYDATVVKKLKEQKAIILGKTNLEEFAIGSLSENSTFSSTKNPLMREIAGSLSEGSATAVATNECTFALGSDTGGSLRVSASFWGTVGLKPTYGAVSRYGLIAFASSLDQIGPITKTVEDCQIVFGAIKGKDEKDSTSVKLPEFKNWKLKIKNLCLGVPKEYFNKGIDPKVEKAMKRVIKKYEEMGIKFEEVSLPHTEYALSAYYVISSAEASSNLARYDGIKYGYSKREEGKGQRLLDVYLESRREGFGKEVRKRIMLGTYFLSAGCYEDYYLRAQKVRTLIRNDFEEVFKKVDALITLISLSRDLGEIYTAPLNLVGLPAISCPVGKGEEFSVNFQLIGKAFEEEKILEVAKLYESC